MANAISMRSIHPGATSMRTGTRPPEPFDSGLGASPLTSQDGARIFSVEMQNLNARSSIIWSEYAERESLGQKVWRDTHERFSRNMGKRARECGVVDKGVGKEYRLEPHHRDPLYNPLVNKPLKAPQYKTLPRGVAHVEPAMMFKSGFNSGCYKQYQKIDNPDLPESHCATKAVQMTPITKPGGGSIVTQRGTSALSPTRFCRKNAAKSWVDYLSQSHVNNKFQTLETTSAAAFPETEQRWKMKVNGRHGARQQAHAMEFERAMKSQASKPYNKPSCGIKIHGFKSSAQKKKEARERSVTADGAKRQQLAQLNEREEALAAKEAALDQREHQLRSGTAIGQHR